MVNTLVSAADLMDFPGAPYPVSKIDVAAAAVRAEAGWHIAPVVTETITVGTWGGLDVVLPSLRVVSVTAVRSAGSVVADWILEPGGFLYLRKGWGIGFIEVDLVHGYDSTPKDLFPLLASLAARTTRDPDVQTQTIGQVSISYRNVASTDPTLSKYKLPPGIA